jgi:hypothetical protein
MERLPERNPEREHEHDHEHADRPSGHFFPPPPLAAFAAFDRRERAHGV